VERYGLRQNWEQFQGQLNGRWPVRFADVSGVKIVVNTVAVSNWLYKEFQHKARAISGAVAGAAAATAGRRSFQPATRSQSTRDR